MLQFSSSQFSNLRWRYFVESLLLKSTPNVSSVVLSSARVAGVDRADARASSVAREPPRFFGETAALRVAGFLAGAFGLAAGFLAAGFFGGGDFLTAGFLAGAGDAARGFAAGFAAGFFLGEAGLRLRGSGVADRFGCTRVGFGDAAALGLAALGLRPRTYFWTLPP